MAENTQNFGNIAKIDCRSGKAVNIVNKTVYNRLFETLEKDEDRSEEEKRRYFQKFQAIYEKMVQDNLVNGETFEATAADTTPEYEPVDKQKELCINEELLPQLDDYVVKVAKQRKRLPRACCKAVSDFSNHQALFMSKVKPSAQEVDSHTVVSDAKNAAQFIDCQRLREPCSTLTELIKTTTKDQERAVHLSKAVEIEAANRDCQTAAVLRHCSASKDGAHHSVYAHCLCKRKSDSSAQDAHATKRARSSFMFAHDFVVQPLSL